ncbi:LysE family translocator [Corynebacterium sp. H78]|uniref:LysE family translocator n=1 Tax=Corynebacterium sp. H78 TaxID=3133417 RepID=UPI0030B457FC
MISWPAYASMMGMHLVGMSTPGPDILMILRLATKSRKHALAAVMGISTGSLLWISLTVFGVAAVLAATPSAMGAIQTLGGAYLGYMAWKMLSTGFISMRQMQAGADPSVIAGSGQLSPLRSTFWQGMLTNLSNPKIVLFFTAVLTQFIPVGAPLWDLMFVAVSLLLFQIFYFSMVAILVSTEAVVKRMVNAGPYIDMGAGVIFAVMSVIFVVEGITTLV